MNEGERKICPFIGGYADGQRYMWSGLHRGMHAVGYWVNVNVVRISLQRPSVRHGRDGHAGLASVHVLLLSSNYLLFNLKLPC